VHYYAMQFIQGLGLDCVLQELRQLRPAEGRPPPASALPTQPALGPSVAHGLLTGRFAAPDSAATNPQATAPPVRLGSPDLPVGPASRAGQAAGPPAAAGSGGSPLVVAGEDSELTAQSETQYFRSVARVGVQVAEALAHAHQQGVVHRDVKPSNLLLDTRGTVWVTDFGLAKAAGSGELTSPGEIVGTLRYMAPERFGGVTDARGDVYGLGATLYELLTLRLPFEDGDRLGLIRRVLHEAPVPPRRIDRRVPRDLETIVLKAIEKDPERRFQTAAEMADELRLFLADRPLQIRRSGLRERCWRWCRRNPAVASLAGLVAALLLSVAVVSSWAWWSTGRQLRRTREAEDEATRRLYRSLVDQARASRRSRAVGQRFDGLEALRKAAGIARQLGLPEEDFLELRNEVIACLALPDAQVAREWGGWPTDSTAVDFDDKFERCAFETRAGVVTVRHTADGTDRYRFPAGGGFGGPQLSRDGRFLAVGGSHGVGPYRLWDLTGPKERILVKELACTCCAFSPDSRWFAAGMEDGSLRLYDLPSGRWRSLGGGPRPFALVFRPDQRQLAVSHRGGVQVRDLDTGGLVADLPQAVDGHLAWHPDGKTLAVPGRDLRIRLWDVPSRREILALEGTRREGIRLAFSHAGDLLASTSWDGFLRLWDPRTGRQLLQVPWAQSGPPRFRSDDRLISGDGRGCQVRLWEITRPRGYRLLARDPVFGKAPYLVSSVHPAGRLLAVSTTDGFGL
jgi:hypothetical protein